MSVLEEDGVLEYNLKTQQGDTFSRSLAFSDDEGNPIDITGYTIFFTVKDKIDEGDGGAEISKTVTSHVDAVAGLSAISATAAEMAALDGDYFYDIQIKNALGEIYTVINGRFIVKKQITQRTS